MRRTDKRRYLQTLLQESEVLERSRTHLRSLGEIVGGGRAADMDAILLKLDAIIGDAIQEVAMSNEEDESRTPEEKAADAKLRKP